MMSHDGDCTNCIASVIKEEEKAEKIEINLGVIYKA